MMIMQVSWRGDHSWKQVSYTTHPYKRVERTILSGALWGSTQDCAIVVATDAIGAFEVAILSLKIKHILGVELRTTSEGPIDCKLFIRLFHLISAEGLAFEGLDQQDFDYEMAQHRSLKRRKYSRGEEEEEEREMREERMPTAMATSSTFVPMPCCFSAPSTAPMGAAASYVLIMEAQNRIKLKTDWNVCQNKSKEFPGVFKSGLLLLAFSKDSLAWAGCQPQTGWNVLKIIWKH